MISLVNFIGIVFMAATVGWAAANFYRTKNPYDLWAAITISFFCIGAIMERGVMLMKEKDEHHN